MVKMCLLKWGKNPGVCSRLQLSHGYSPNSVNQSNNALMAILWLHLHHHFLSGDQSKWGKKGLTDSL